MAKAATPQRWFAGWRATRMASRRDAADYGTAFGLDMSLDDSPPAAQPAADRRPAWVRRLMPGRRPAT